MLTKAEMFSTKEQLSGDLGEVPGFGLKGIDNLKAKGIHTTYQIIGKFLEFDRDVQKLHDFLVSPEIGMQPGPLNTHRTAERIGARVLGEGFKCEIKLSDHVIKSTVSMFNDAKKTAFMSKKLSGDLAADFTGIKNIDKFKAAGIHNTDQLFAAFLKIIDDPHPGLNTSKCDEFYRLLGSLGAASGYKSAIIYQLQAKLAVGIDTEGLGIEYCPVLPAVPEGALDKGAYDRGKCSTSRSGTGTGEQPRRTARRGGTAGVEPRQLFGSTPPAHKPTRTSKDEPSDFMFALPILLALAAYVWMYLPSSSTELALR